MGYRPSRVVKLAEPDLDALLFPAADRFQDKKQVRRVLEMIVHFQERRLVSELRKLLKRLGPRDFLVDVVAPLLDSVGRAWADGDVEIRHEHFLTEVLEDLLRSIRQSIRRPTKGPRVVLATLSGESHGLGLQMVAVVCRLAGVPTRILGVHTPPEEISRTVSEVRAAAVALSVSLATGGIDTDRTLRDLRGTIADNVFIAVGGRGARGVRRGPRGVDYFRDLESFEGWVKGLRAR